MTWQHIQIARFGGPEVLSLVDEAPLPEPGPDEVRIKVLAAGTGFTDTFIRRGRYPDFKGPLPFTPGYELVGTIDAVGPGVSPERIGELVADLCVVGGYAQYAIRPARFLVPVPSGVDAAEAVCIPLAYLTAYQMLLRYRSLRAGDRIFIAGASGSVGTALLDLARYFGLAAIGTCSTKNIPIVESYGAQAIDYHAEDFVAAVHRLTDGAGVDMAFDAIGGAHFKRSFASPCPQRPADRLWIADHGHRRRGSRICRAWLGASQSVGCARRASPAGAAPPSTASPRGAGRTRKSSWPIWRRCSRCSRMAPSTPLWLTACRSQQPARSTSASMPGARRQDRAASVGGVAAPFQHWARGKNRRVRRKLNCPAQLDPAIQ